MTPKKKAQKQKLALVKQLKGLSPSDFAELLHKASTPRKKKELNKIGYVTSPVSAKKQRVYRRIVYTMKNQISKLKKKKDNSSRGKLKVISSFLTKAKDSSKVRKELYSIIELLFH